MYKKTLVISLCLYFACHPLLSRADDSAGFYAQLVENRDQNLIIDLWVDSGTQSANVISLDARYPANQLEIINLDLASSTCTLFLAQEVAQGQINIICGRPNPGFTGQALIGRLEMRRLSPAKSALDILDSSLVLANDGLGSVIETKKNDLSL